MSCQHLKKSGVICGRKIIPGSTNCSLKSHHSDKEQYDFILKREINSFNTKTVDIDNYDIYDVLPDGSCLFRSIAQGLIPIKDKIQNKEMFEKALEYNKRPSTKDEMRSSLPDWILNDATETGMARFLQKISVDWLCDHADEELIEGVGHKISDCVLETHELSNMVEYKSLYSIFAGDSDFIMYDSGKRYKSGPRVGTPIYKREYIKDRWGSFPEQFALSKIFGVNIVVYVPRRFSNYQFKILKEPNLNKARLYPYAQSGPTVEMEETPQINLILLERPKTSHYMVAFDASSK